MTLRVLGRRGPRRRRHAFQRRESDPRPAACDEDPDGLDAGPATLITELAMAADDCCFDFSGDGGVDNELGGMLSGLGHDLRSGGHGDPRGRIELPGCGQCRRRSYVDGGDVDHTREYLCRP